MSEIDCEKIEALLETIKPYDSENILTVLNDNNSFAVSEVGGNLLHLICKYKKPEVQTLCSSSDWSKDVIYGLVNCGLDTEEQDEHGNTCLFNAVKNENCLLCDVLLQCGADMWANTEFDVSVYDYVLQTSSDELKYIFNKFYPGLWKSVECEDIYQVRKLINLWCRTNLFKNGIALKDIALKTGNEGIISLILGIFETMELVYHILAKNVKAIRNLLETSRKRLRLDLRKMSDRGAPILYYLIQSKDVPVIELFISHGCQVYTIMQDIWGYDMPVLFTALTSDVPTSVIEALLPKTKPQLEEMLHKILYRGKTVLEVAMEQSVTVEVFNILIDRGGPLLLCKRNQLNQSVRDFASLSMQKQYVSIIDENVLSWILYPWKFPGRRQQLALFGWDLETTEFEKEFKADECAKEFLSQMKAFQAQIKCLSEAIEAGDVAKFVELKISCFEFDSLDKKLLWHGRVVGDGLPLLHRAVLHNRSEIVEMILGEKPPMESIDNLFDQNHRTALHYAYACSSFKKIKNLLLNSGCSEHVLDKANKEPLDFRDKQDSPRMLCLLNRLKSKDFSIPEPDPWEIEASICTNEISYEETTTLPSLHCDSGSETSEISDEEENRKFCVIT